MFYLEKKGFGPFKKMVLMCKPYRNAKPYEVKDLSEFAPNLQVEKNANGLMRLSTPKGSTNNDIYRFDIFNGVVTYVSYDNEHGFITRDNTIVGNDLGMSVIAHTDVAGDVVIVEQIHKKSHHKTYIALSSIDGKRLLDRAYDRYEIGDRDKFIKGMVFFDQADGLRTLVSTAGLVIAEDCFKYDIARGNLVTLSRCRKGPEKTLLECTAMRKGETPKLTLVMPDVEDFELNVDSLIAKGAKESSVYSIPNVEAGEAEKAHLKFKAKGEIKDITPSFYSDRKYLNIDGKSKTLLDENGTPATNPDLKGLKHISYADSESYITTIETAKGRKQGMIRTSDYATLIPPAYDKVRKIGKNEVIATYGDSFAVYGLVEEQDSHEYSTYTQEIVGFNNYFYPQLTNKDNTILCRDSNDMDCVLVAKHGVAKVKPVPNYGREEMGLEEYDIIRDDFQHEDESSLGLPTQGK